MEVYLNKISGYAGAITCLYHSKRSWTRKLEKEIYLAEECSTTRDGHIYIPAENELNTIVLNTVVTERKRQFYKQLQKVCKFGKQHITLLRYIDLEFTVEGLHRGAQDDFDAHAKRLDNRIVRSSTRLAEFGNEKSEWYEDKILTIDEVVEMFNNISLPEKIYKAGDSEHAYIKTTNGYIREDLADDNDVKRGLYMLSIPSNFTAKCNITEFAHIVKLRDKDSHANPELKQMIEELLVQIECRCPLFNRDLFYEIAN